MNGFMDKKGWNCYVHVIWTMLKNHEKRMLKKLTGNESTSIVV